MAAPSRPDRRRPRLIAKLLRDTIAADGFPLSLRAVWAWKAVLAEPEPPGRIA
jgi:hypothetical protein